MEKVPHSSLPGKSMLKRVASFNTIVLHKTVVGRVPAEAGHDAMVNSFLKDKSYSRRALQKQRYLKQKKC